MNALANMIDRPFAPPLDMVLDIPVPPSVNRTRRVNWAHMKIVNDWKKRADVLLIASGQFRKAKDQNLTGPFEITIILNEKLCRLDPDNPVKAAVDYLRALELIPNDSPKFVRRIVIEWGEAPEGCRMIVRPAEVQEAA